MCWGLIARFLTIVAADPVGHKKSHMADVFALPNRSYHSDADGILKEEMQIQLNDVIYASLSTPFLWKTRIP